MSKLKKRKDGRFKRQFQFRGKSYYVYGRTKQEVEEKIHQKRLELESGRDAHENPTLDAYYERWTENRRDSVRESTLYKQQIQYNACANVKIQGAGRLGDFKINEITVDDIRDVQKALQASGKATQTVNGAIAHLTHVFYTAVDERRIEYNPCKLVKPLKRKEECARDTIHRALTVEETKVFFEAAAGSFYYDVFRFAINTGMRCGEIGAIYLSDIRDGKIHVERTITKSYNGGYEIGESAKTENGRRQIPLNDALREIIEHQRTINRMLDGGRVVEIHERIFKAPERGLLMATPVDREIGRICKRTGIDKFTMHAFRATFATRCIESGINPRTVQELLGHKDFSITMNLYGHVVDETKAQAMNVLRIVI